MTYKFKLFIGSREEDVAEYEKLRSLSYEDEGGITVVKEETKLTEAGDYLIALHWLEDGASSSTDKASIRDLLEDKV